MCRLRLTTPFQSECIRSQHVRDCKAKPMGFPLWSKQVPQTMVAAICLCDDGDFSDITTRDAVTLGDEFF